MTAAERQDRAKKAGYDVWPSRWEDSAGKTGTSWVVTRPDGGNLDDYEGSEAAGWRAAYADMAGKAVPA